MAETVVMHVGSRQIISQDILQIQTNVSVASIFTRVKVGQTLALIDNHSGRYSPERAFTFSGITGQNSASLSGGSQDSAIDSKIGCASFWFKRATTGNEVVWHATGDRFKVEFDAGNNLRWTVANSNATVIGDVETTAAFTNTTSWHHALISWDMATANIDIYVDDASQGLTTNTALANSNVDWTTDDINLMSEVGEANPFTGSIAQAYINVRESIDITDEATRRKFIDAEGKPVFMGQFGEGPSGRMPYMLLPFLSSEGVAFNRGYGQDFTEVSSVTHLTPSEIDVAPLDVRAGVPFNLSITTNAGSAYQLFTGTVRESRARSERNAQVLRLEAEDNGYKLRRLTQVPFRFNTVVQSVFVDVLSSVGFTAHSLDTLDTRVAFADLDNIGGGEAVSRILETGAHYAFVGPAGQFEVRERNFDVDKTSVYSLSAFRGLQYEHDIGRVMNDISIASEARAPTVDTRTIATLPASVGVFLPASGSPGTGRGDNSITLRVDYADSDTLQTGIPVQSVVTPVASTHFRVTENIEGTGYDITSAVTTSFQGFARSAIFTIENNTSSNAILSSFHLEGHPVQPINLFAFNSTDVDSIARFERREFEIVSELIDDPLYVRAYTEFLQQQYSEPLGRVQISLVNQDPEIYEIGLMSQLHVQESNAALGRDFIVEGMTHNIIPGDADHEHSVRYELRPSLDKEYMVLDDPTRGITDDGNRLGF